MGTRNLTAIKVDGDIKVAQYGQWDGYPDGAGLNIMNTIQQVIAQNGVGYLANNVRNCRVLENDEVVALYEELGIEGEWISFEDAERFKEAHPQLDRDMGSDIVRFIYNNGPCDISLSTDFATDSLFCEWAYIVDLDNEAVEVYCGGCRDVIDGNGFAEALGTDDVVGLIARTSFDEIADGDIEQIAEDWAEIARN